MNSKENYEAKLKALENEVSGIRYELKRARQRFIDLTQQLHEETARLVKQANADFDTILDGSNNTLYASPAEVAIDSVMRQLHSVTFEAAKMEAKLLSAIERISTIKEVWGDYAK
jgi:F0F1-type ATP synthase membrane subunit b/b'